MAYKRHRGDRLPFQDCPELFYLRIDGFACLERFHHTMISCNLAGQGRHFARGAGPAVHDGYVIGGVPMESVVAGDVDGAVSPGKTVTPRI